jgi:hypothetical protein
VVALERTAPKLGIHVVEGEGAAPRKALVASEDGAHREGGEIVGGRELQRRGWPGGERHLAGLARSARARPGRGGRQRGEVPESLPPRGRSPDEAILAAIAQSGGSLLTVARAGARSRSRPKKSLER